MKLGFFNAPIKNINYQDASILGQGLTFIQRKLQLKDWNGFFIQHPEACFEGGIVDAATTLGLSQFTTYDRNTEESFYSMAIALGRNYQLAESTWDGYSFIDNQKGYRMEFHHMLEKERSHKIIMDIEAKDGKPAIKAYLTLYQDISKIMPLVVSLPAKPCNHMYTNKTPMMVEGYILMGDRRFYFDPSRDIAIMDEHKAYYPPETYWNWATFACYDESKQLIGLNLTDNKTFRDQKFWNENCIWQGHGLSMIGTASFDFYPEEPMKPWKMTEENDRVNLEFTPKYKWINDVYYLIVFNMNYYNLVGYYNGYLRDDKGKKIPVNNFCGQAEKYHVWS